MPLSGRNSMMRGTIEHAKVLPRGRTPPPGPLPVEGRGRTARRLLPMIVRSRASLSPQRGEGRGEGCGRHSALAHSIGLASLLLALFTPALIANQRPPASPQLAGYGKLPLSFEANHGQADGQVQ